MPEIMREMLRRGRAQDLRSEREARGGVSECGYLGLLEPQVPCRTSCSQVITMTVGNTGERLVHPAERRAGFIREGINDDTRQLRARGVTTVQSGEKSSHMGSSCSGRPATCPLPWVKVWGGTTVPLRPPGVCQPLQPTRPSSLSFPCLGKPSCSHD